VLIFLTSLEKFPRDSNREFILRNRETIFGFRESYMLIREQRT